MKEEIISYIGCSEAPNIITICNNVEGNSDKIVRAVKRLVRTGDVLFIRSFGDSYYYQLNRRL